MSCSRSPCRARSAHEQDGSGHRSQLAAVRHVRWDRALSATAVASFMHRTRTSQCNRSRASGHRRSGRPGLPANVWRQHWSCGSSLRESLFKSFYIIDLNVSTDAPNRKGLHKTTHSVAATTESKHVTPPSLTCDLVACHAATVMGNRVVRRQIEGSTSRRTGTLRPPKALAT